MLSGFYGYYAKGMLGRCAVNYLTRCQEMLTLECDNSVTRCDTMEDTYGAYFLVARLEGRLISTHREV
jgi:hypothetical protein